MGCILKNDNMDLLTKETKGQEKLKIKEARPNFYATIQSFLSGPQTLRGVCVFAQKMLRAL